MENEHEFPSLISETSSSQNLSNILENSAEINSLNDIEKEFTRLSPSIYSIDFSSIPYIDSSSLIDDQELSEKTHSSSDLNRKISLSESDLLSSLHRNLNKQILDNPSEDEILFLEWDKERHLFQDYINSLRKEIRVLLQERAEYQQDKIYPNSKYLTDDQMKIDLLQKSLEEKNFVIEQFQSEYELMKEKNTNLLRKISLEQCDTKSYLTIINELKEKIADITIDLQNHLLVKRRLEISINNLENDCQIIDAERIRLTNDIKENQHKKQDLEKLLQKANVQIAEQGSTIEMLRSENVQVRSQLSTIQRRMFQEKQQIMDYLRQIETDLIEKEQIKQRESLLRQDYEQLKNSLHQNQQQIEEFKQNCSQLLKEKDQFQSEIKNLYSHFHIPVESDNQSNLSCDNIIQPIETRFNDLQKQNNTLINQMNELQTIKINETGDENNQRSDREDELQRNLAILTAQCAQLDEANRAWQQFQQTQLENFRHKLQHNLPIENNFSFDEIAQLIIDYLTQITNERDSLIQNLQSAEKIHQGQSSHTELSSFSPIKQRDITPIEETPLQNLTSVQSIPSRIHEHDEELRQLRENIATLTIQCTQLNEANGAWQQYQFTQLDHFRNKLQDYIDLDEHFSFDQAAQLIIDRIIKERKELEKTNEDLRAETATNLETIKQSYTNTINELTQELSVMKEELEKRNLETDQSQSVDEVSFTPNDEEEEVLPKVNPIDILRNRLEDSFAIDYNLSLDEIAQQIVDAIEKERKEFHERYQTLEKEHHDLRSESETNLETIRQSYLNTVNELNLELLAIKDQSFINNQEPDTQTIESSSSDSNLDEINRIYEELRNILPISNEASLEEIILSINNLIKEKDLFEVKEIILTKDLESVNQQLMDVYHQCEQLQEYNQQLLAGKQDDQVQQEYLLLQNQYTQLDNANRAWQQFYDNQLDLIRNQLKDYLDFDQNLNFNQIIQIIATEFQQQKNPLGATVNSNGLSNQSSIDSEENDEILTLQEEIKSLENQLKDHQSSIDLLKNNLQLTTNENEQLKQQYSEIQEKYHLLIKDNHNQFNDQHVSQSQQIHRSSIEESSIHTNTPVQSSNIDEIHQLQTNLSLLTAQCSQLDEANRAWQQFHQNQLELFHEKLQDWIPMNPNSTLEQIAQEILNEFDSLQKQLTNYQSNETILAQNLEELNQKLLDVHKQCEEFREHNAQLILSKQKIEKQLEEREEFNDRYQALEKTNHDLRIDLKELIQNENLNDRPIEQNHIAIETIPLIHQNNQTQMDPIQMIHQQNQTELLCSISDDENYLNENNERLNEYINEISSLSSADLFNHLKNECEQILLKQNVQPTSFLNLELHQLVLITLYCLSNQHLIDEAKQLYNESVLRALKQEYEVINNEKNDLIQQIESDNQQKVNNNVLQILKDKIDQIVIERPDLFPDLSDDTIERLDDFISAIENQAAQIDLLKKELNNSPPAFSEKEIEQLIHQRNQAREEKSIVDEEIYNLKSQLAEQSEILIHEREKYEELAKSSSRINPTIDNETQTDDQQQDKSVQMNNKLKRALQTIKEKIHRIITERPELFPQMSEDTIERLDQLISVVDNQTKQIERLQHEHDYTQQEVNELRSSFDNECAVEAEQLTSQASLIEDYQNLPQNLSQKEEERVLLQHQLNEVELELRKTLDDQRLTTSRFEAILEQQTLQLTESEHEIEQLKEEIAQLKQTEISSDEDIQLLKDTIEQQSQELKDLSEKYLSQIQSQDELNKQKKETEQQFNEQKNRIENLIQERANLLHEIENTTLPTKQTTDNDSQTDDRQHEKLVQVNNKLKRALQSFKDKIHRVVIERPDLFDGTGEETSERLDHLISTVENQATQIDVLQAEHDQMEKQLQNEIKQLQNTLESTQNEIDNERQMKMEQLSSPPENISASIAKDYQKQIEELQQNLSEKDDERSLLSERLNEVELELRKALDDHASTTTEYKLFVEERDALSKQEAHHSAESQREIEQLREELAELKRSSDYQHVEIQTDEDIEALRNTIEQQFQQIKDLNEKNDLLSSQLKSQTDLDREKKEVEERLNERENEIDQLKEERATLLEEIENKTLPTKQTTDNESQTDDHQHEKLVQVNNKLKRALQSFKDKIHRVVINRPDLFHDIGEETSERLDHLIATVENQATQVNVLQTERDQADEKYQRQMKELQSSLEACQYELDNERQIKTERLASATPLSSLPTENISSSIHEDYQKQIKQLQQNLSQKDDERTLLRERLNEVELELRKTLDDHASTMAEYESLVEERDALVEQEARRSTESQHEIEQLREELIALTRSSGDQHVGIQTEEDIEALYETIEQQSQQITDLNEKTATLSSQLESQTELIRQKKEVEEQLNEYKNEIDHLKEERATLLEEVEKKTVLVIQTTDNESQTDDRQHEKLIQVNNKLKRALQTFKDKIHRAVTESPDLFDGVGEETSERLDHLISTVGNQASQIEMLHAGRVQVEEQLRNEIKELQSSLETSQNELDSEHKMKMEQLSSPPEDTSSSIVHDYQKQIDELQEKLSQKEDEHISLSERLNEVDLELRKAVDDHASAMVKYQSLVEQQTLHAEDSQREIEQLKAELVELKQFPVTHHVQTQTDEDIQILHEMIEQQSQQVKDLNEKNTALSSQLDSQNELDRQKKEAEERVEYYQNQNESLMQERANLLKEIENKTLPTKQTTDSDSQTDDRQHEKLVQANNRLKRTLRIYKDKIEQVVTERPDLFDGIGEETSERLNHLISTVENQATQVNVLQAERDQMEKQLQNEIKQLQNSLETTQNELDNERQMKMEQLSSPPENISASIVKDYQKQIEELQQNLSEKDDERSLLSERLNEVELELRKALDDHASTTTEYESCVEERDALIKQEAHHAAESQREIEQLREKLAELKRSSDNQHLEIQTDENIEALRKTIEQQFQQIKDLNEKTDLLSSQLKSQTELDREKREVEERLNERENEIDHLKEERDTLLEEVENKTLPTKQTTDNESQTDDHQHEKLVQGNNKLKHTLRKYKDKIDQVVMERPDLFDGIGEETSERLNHLLLTVENQATQINVLQVERDQMEEQLQNEIKQLQSSLETTQNELDNERTSLSERLNQVELELRKTLDDHFSKSIKNEENLQSVVAERNSLIEQQTLYSEQHQRELEQLKNDNDQIREELAELKQPTDCQHVEIQTDEDINTLEKLIEQQTEQLKTLNDKCLDLSSQIDSNVELQAEANRQKNEAEAQISDYRNQVENLVQEREKLLEEIEKNTSTPLQTKDNESQTDDREHETLVEANNKLKSVLQTFTDKIHRAVTERPALFDGIGEETNERLEHMISTIENQAGQIDVLHANCDQVEEQLRNENKELQNSLDAYRYQIENERPTTMEQLVTASPAENISSSVIEDYQKKIGQLQQTLSENENERSLLSERFNKVELELRRALDDQISTMAKYESLVEQQTLHSTESQREIEQLKKELAELEQLADYQHAEIQKDQDIQALNELIEQFKDMHEKNATLSSQLQSHAELYQQKEEVEERLDEHKNQIDNLIKERTKLLEEIENNYSTPIETTEIEVQTDDDEHKKSFKSALEIIENKIHHLITTKPDLFGDTGEETNERLDHVISTIEKQAAEIAELQIEYDQTKEKYQHEINDLQNSFDIYRQQTDEHISSLTPLTHEMETQTIDFPPNESQNLDRRDTQSTESDDNESNNWFDASPDITEKEEIEPRQFRDIDIQCEFDQPSSLSAANSTQTEIDVDTENLKAKLEQIALDHPTLFSTSNKNPSEALDQIISFIKNLQNEINELQSSFDIYRNEIENERLIQMEKLKSQDVSTQTLGLSIFEEHKKQIESVHQREIEHIIEERNQARDLLTQWQETTKINNYESSLNPDLVDENKQITSPPLKIDVEMQTTNELDLLSSSDQSISRRIFEQEMLAWSKESEQLKRFVKQIQIENKKLKTIILKFENMIHNYMHENERLKQENHHLSLMKYSEIEKQDFTISDQDICYLTLKCLTYEVAQRTSNNEQLLVSTNQSERDLKQQVNDTERQMKTIRVQNERLKNQLESYTIQFKHVQHEMSVKIREMLALKDETERLRTNEIQSRLEIDRLKSELEDDQLKIQQLESELSDLKYKQSSKDTHSIDNLRELLELKERELNALKEKLDYTKQTHQTELQEALKANQFSLDNVKRFEQMDLCHEEKRRELETRLGKFCTITRPLIKNEQFFFENPIINLDELRKLIAATDTEERIANSLSPIRDCLSLLEAQMKDLHHSIIENHARRSKRWKYKLGFECLSCESRWEVTHDIRDLQEACLDPNRFLESSIVEPMAGCSCPIMIDFVESDIRLCLDDMINDVIVRTTVK